jgi:hypothetical protein
MRKDSGGGWFGPRRIEVPCTVEIERSFDSLHAHAIPEGIMLRPGDRVVINNLPDNIAHTGTTSFETTATVFRAHPLTRWWTEMRAIAELTELYHCGFEPKDAFEGEAA